MQTITFNVEGLSCSHCEHRICKSLLKENGVKGCSASSKSGKVLVKFDQNATDTQKLKELITQTGYTVKE